MYQELTGEKFDDAKAEKEIVARVMETFFGEGESTSERQVDLTNFIMEFTAANKNAATRIWYKLTQMAKRIREDIAHYATKKVWGENYDSSYREHQLMLRKIEDLRDSFGRALMEAKGKPGDGKRAFKVANNRGGYNVFRTMMAKEALDKLSVKLGDEFPLSANFDKTMRANNTPLQKVTVIKNTVTITKGKNLYATGRSTFTKAYGDKTTVKMSQSRISAELWPDVVDESLSKRIGKGSVQSILDIIPHLDQILQNSILLGIEKVNHTDNKNAALFVYKVYGVFDYYDGKTKTPHCLSCSVVQHPSKAEAYVYRDIKIVTAGQGGTGNKTGVSQPAQGQGLPGNKSGMSQSSSYSGNIDSIAQLYDFVKRVKREDGGLKYNSSEKLNYLFSYTERNDGTQYSLSKSNTTPQNELEAKMKAQALSLYADMRKAQKAQRATDITEESIYEQTGWYFDDYGNFVVDREAPVYVKAAPVKQNRYVDNAHKRAETAEARASEAYAENAALREDVAKWKARAESAEKAADRSMCQ